MNNNYFKIAHNNLRDTIKYRITNIDGGKLLATDDFLLFTIGIPSTDGHLNGCLSFNNHTYEEIFNEAQKFFTDFSVGFSFWIRNGIDVNLASLLESKGYEPKRRPGSSVMITKNRIQEAPLPSGYELRQVNCLESLEDFKFVIKATFGKDDKIIDAMFSSKENAFSKNFKSFCIYNDQKKPVSAALASITPDSSGIYYVSTLEEERSNGLGKAITKAATNVGFDEGKDIVILQASELGEAIYKNLTFKKVGSYLSYYSPVE